MTQTPVNNFSLSVEGLTINSTSFDPRATCALFQELDLIEDFTSDQNGEPVLLYTDNNEPRGYHYQFWCDFVKEFYFPIEAATLLLELLEFNREFKKHMATINYLLSPLQAA